jgi:hypothetical protein
MLWIIARPEDGAARSSITLIRFYQTARHYIPEGRILNAHDIWSLRPDHSLAREHCFADTCVAFQGPVLKPLSKPSISVEMKENTYYHRCKVWSLVVGQFLNSLLEIGFV